MPQSPLITTLIQSTFLNALSNILAQLIDQYLKKKDGFTFTLNTFALLQFITYGVLIVPINMAWQRWLEVTYPGFLFGSTTSSSSATAPSLPIPNQHSVSPPSAPPELGAELVEVKEKLVRAPTWKPAPTSLETGKRRRIMNFAMKFLLDQTAGGILNIILFVVLINLLKGVSLGRCVELVKEDLMPIMLARLKYRPVVSTLMYTVVPLDRRVVFGSACGVLWGVYLSLYAVV
ncbi:hypothetical protein BJX99DRAFT_262420 [Aspergillus californicus]